MSQPISQSLYRKWRPQTFQDVKGQDAIRDTIFYALSHGQMSQAYLFCGPRGTGKTTTARLIAKLVNCQAEDDKKPCNTCPACLSITEGSNLDILELDAASNRGIDEIRQLRDTVRFSPTQARYKVFIIDEVHMLTREAFNALLKTLEEPPSYALFILATTEVHKIPPTILSRCQRYDFRIATQETLADHLLAVAKAEKMPLSPDAARFLARLADGSFRDALTLLEQVASHQAEKYTLETVENLFGYVPRDQVVAILGAIFIGDTTQAHTELDTLLTRGADLRAVCDQLLQLSQECLEALAMQTAKTLPASLQPTVASLGLAGMVRWIELLLEAMTTMKQSPIPRLPLDIAIAKMSTPTIQPAPRPTPVTVPHVVVHVEAPQPQPMAKSAPETIKAPVTETVSVPVAAELPQVIEPEDWAKILTELKEEAPSLVTSLAHAKVLSLDGDLLAVGVRYKMHAEAINKPAKRAQIEQVLEKVLNAPLKIAAQVVNDLPEQEEIADIASVFELEEE